MDQSTFDPNGVRELPAAWKGQIDKPVAVSRVTSGQPQGVRVIASPPAARPWSRRTRPALVELSASVSAMGGPLLTLARCGTTAPTRKYHRRHHPPGDHHWRAENRVTANDRTAYRDSGIAHPHDPTLAG